MRRIAALFIMMPLLFGMICSAHADDAVLIRNMNTTNSIQDKNGLTSEQWASNSKLRAIMSMMMIIDFAMDDHSKASFDDVAYLDTSYFTESDGMIIVIFRGRNYLNGYSVMIMYTPADRDGAYCIYSDDEFGSFAMLKEALSVTYGNVIENDLNEMVEISNSLGMNYYAEDEDSANDATTQPATIISGGTSDVGSGYFCKLLAYKGNGKWGYLDKKGNIAIQPQWDYVDDFDEGFASVFIGTLNEKGRPDQGEYGVIDTDGNYIIPLMKCKSISVFNPLENDISVTYENINGDYNYEYYRIDGSRIGNDRWENSYDPDGDNYICACFNGKWGYVDRSSGENIIKYQFDSAEPFSGDLACVGMNKELKLTSYYINRSGETVIENKGWDCAYSFEDSSNVAVVFKGTTLYDGELPDEGKYALLDRSGNLLCDYIWDKINVCDNGLIIVGTEMNGKIKYGVINESMETVVEPEWDYIGGYSSNGFAEVFKGTLTKYGYPEEGMHGFIDTNGKQITELKWADVYEFHPDGYAVVKTKDNEGNEKFGLINSVGEEIIDPVFDDIPGRDNELFCDGLTLVEVGGLFGYIDTSGSLCIEPLWDRAEAFSEGLAVVWKQDTWHVINTDGNIVY